MATDKTFTHAGTSLLNGKRKWRFGNGAARARVLAYNGHEDVDLRELPRAMTKFEAVKWLIAQGFDRITLRFVKPKVKLGNILPGEAELAARPLTWRYEPKAQ